MKVVLNVLTGSGSLFWSYSRRYGQAPKLNLWIRTTYRLKAPSLTRNRKKIAYSDTYSLAYVWWTNLCWAQKLIHYSQSDRTKSWNNLTVVLPKTKLAMPAVRTLLVASRKQWIMLNFPSGTQPRTMANRAARSPTSNAWACTNITSTYWWRYY